MEDWATIKEDIIRAEKSLEEAGYYMRLYGSISHRIDEDSFYFIGGELRDHDIQPDELHRVKVKHAQGESAVHAAIYRVRQDVNAVLYTGQCFGSALGVLSKEGIAAEDADGRVVKIRVAPFTPPGSDAQRSHMRRLVAREKDVGVVIAANHGVIAFGESLVAAGSNAVSLEQYANLYLAEIGNTSIPCGVVHGYDSVRTEGEIHYREKDTPARVKLIHEQIYETRPDVGAIIHNKSEAAVTVSRLNERLVPLYDDFVRLVGPGAEIPRDPHGGGERDQIYVSAGVNISFCYDDGAYCYGRDERMAGFIALSTERNCIAQIAAARLNGAHVLSRIDVRRLSRMKEV